MASRLLNDIRIIYQEACREAKDDRLIPMLAIGTFENYARFGHNVGATPDGRLSQEPIGSNYSPALGMDRSGPTAAMKSVVSSDLLPYCGGCPLDIQVNSNEVEGQSGLARMVGLVKSFFDLGGVILTITGVSEEMLRDAQEHPERHRGLRVRLGGLSAYFIALPKKQQEIMIARVKHKI
jgi:pyruvate-formate lyase